VVGQLHGDDGHADIDQRLSQLPQPFRVRAKALPNCQGVVINPQQIAALRPSLAVQRIVHAELLQAPSNSRLLTHAQRLAHLQDHRPVVRDDDRIVHKDGIGMIGQRLVVINHLGSSLPQNIHQSIMLLASDLKIRSADIVPLGGVIDRKGLIASSGRLTNTLRRDSTMLWLPYFLISASKPHDPELLCPIRLQVSVTPHHTHAG